jgi:hypothetical protein
VAHHRQELALRPARRLGLGARAALGLVEPRALQRLRRQAGEGADEGALVVAEAAGLVREVDDRAEHAAGHLERGGDRRADAGGARGRLRPRVARRPLGRRA